MNKRIILKPGIKEGFLAGFPVFIGYFPVAVAFGILAKTTGLSPGDSVAFSIFVFAGASQFMALNLIKAGAAVAGIVLATLLLNLRHLLMSASLAVRFKERKSRWLPLVAFGITDETFAIAATRPERLEIPFLLALEGIAYLGWIGGTLCGYMAGAVLPASLQQSMGVGLYAMFVAIVVPGFKKSWLIIGLTLGSGLIHTALSWLNFCPSGWNLILAIILCSLAGACFMPGESGDSP